MSERLCSVPGCGKKHTASGFCGAHYMRWRRHGDPDVGRTPDGEPIQHLQNVVMRYAGGECLAWPYGKDPSGRAQIYIDGKQRVLARVVCAEEHGPAPTSEHEAAHSCGNAWCINRAHLDWKTHRENEADKLLHGTVIRGARHWNVKLSEESVIAIRDAKGVTASELSERFGVSRRAIYDIITGKRWAWL